MRRQIGFIFIAFIAHMSLFTAIQVFGQQTPGQQSPSIPDDVLGSRLIAWSQLQKPEPVVQPQSQQPRPIQQPDQPSSSTPALTDRANADCGNPDADRGLANGGNRFADRDAQH